MVGENRFRNKTEQVHEKYKEHPESAAPGKLRAGSGSRSGISSSEPKGAKSSRKMAYKSSRKSLQKCLLLVELLGGGILITKATWDG